MSGSAGIRPSPFSVTKCLLPHAYQTSLHPLSPSGPPRGFGDNDLNPLLELLKDHRGSSQGTPARGHPGVRGSPLAAVGRGKEEMDPLDVHHPPPGAVWYFGAGLSPCWTGCLGQRWKGPRAGD